MSLRFRLNLLVTALMLMFILASGEIIIVNTEKSIDEEIEAATKVTVQLLTTAVYSSQFIPGTQTQREVLLDFLKNLGRVRANEIRLHDTLGDVVYTSPPSTYKAGRQAPEWFNRIVAPDVKSTTLPIRGGVLHIVPDSSRAVLDAWDDLSHLIWVALLFVIAVNALVFWLIGRWLKPVRDIMDGLSQMERGRFDVRLPEFALPELSAVSHTFNRMAQTLQDSVSENQRLALLVKQSSDAIFILDRDGRINFWNPAAERLFGYSTEEIAGKPAAMLTPPERREELQQNHEVVLSRQPIENLETKRVTRDGKILDVSISLSPLVDPANDKVIGQICSLRDITEKKRAEETARELAQNRELTRLIQHHVEQERRSLARELHDEMGQCATAIKTIGMTIADRAGGKDPTIHSQAKTIVSVAGQLYDMVHRIIRQLRPSALDHLGLPEALEDTVSSWRARYPEVNFELELSGNLGNLGEDCNITVYRMVQECVTNVVRHAEASLVTIKVARGIKGAEGEILDVTVSDNGKGMLSADSERAAQLGLLGIRERVQSLRGRFELRGEPGKGVAVSARIPLPVKAAA
ncbi:MAG TPA: PAS domain S-box protein [Burkholderiales bacterium]|nr:PAS domain S-box protein [Burkholderiales bacterium]